MKKEKTRFESEKYEVFTLVSVNEEVKICVGNTQICSKTFKTLDEAKKYIDSKPYELIINSTCYIMDYMNKNINKEEKK